LNKNIHLIHNQKNIVTLWTDTFGMDKLVILRKELHKNAELSGDEKKLHVFDEISKYQNWFKS